MGAVGGGRVGSPSVVELGVGGVVEEEVVGLEVPFLSSETLPMWTGNTRMTSGDLILT